MTSSSPAPAPVEAPDAGPSAAAQTQLSRLEHGRSTFGPLAEFVLWAARVRGECPPQPFERVRCIAIASDTAVSSGGSSSARVSAVLEGAAPLALLAGTAGVEVIVVDAGLTSEVPGALSRRVCAGSGAIDREDALAEKDVLAAIELGRALVDEAVDEGVDLLIPAAIGEAADLPAVVATAVLSGREPIFALGFDAYVPDAEWIRRCALVRDALRRTRTLSRDPVQIVQTVGSIDLAVLLGVLLQAAGRRTPVLLDGAVVAAAALLAIELTPAAQGWWLAPQHAPVATERVAWDILASTPVVATELRLGDGCGALATLPLLQNALRVFAALAPTGDAVPAPSSDVADDPTARPDSFSGDG